YRNSTLSQYRSVRKRFRLLCFHSLQEFSAVTERSGVKVQTGSARVSIPYRNSTLSQCRETHKVYEITPVSIPYRNSALSQFDTDAAQKRAKKVSIPYRNSALSQTGTGGDCKDD